MHQPVCSIPSDMYTKLGIGKIVIYYDDGPRREYDSGKCFEATASALSKTTKFGNTEVCVCRKSGSPAKDG